MDSTWNALTGTAAPCTADRKPCSPEALAEIVYAGPAAIDLRLSQLEQEWTIGRAVKVTAALAILAGMALAYYLNSWWLLLPSLTGVLLLQYAVSRHSLLTELFRQFGLRHSIEIEHERLALKALRGDFRNLPTVYDRADDEALARMEGEGGPPSGAMDSELLKPNTKVVVSQVLETVKG
jgi:hypothetical protein